MNLENFQSVETWLRKVRTHGTGSKTTGKTYLTRLNYLCKLLGSNPDELIEEGRLCGGKWPDEICEWAFDLMVSELGYKRTTAATFYGTLRSFLVDNDFLFHEESPRATIETRERLPTREELFKVWQASELDRRLTLSILRSAFRPEDAAALTYGDVKEDYEANAERLYIEKVSQKEDLWFGVFLTKEATSILRLKLEQRKAGGETFTDETPLLTRKRQPGSPITAQEIWYLVTTAGKEVSVKISPKTFRKWFRTYGSPVIGRDAICKMGAWTIPGAGKHYFLPPKEECLANFQKIEHLLSFEEVAVDKHKEEEKKRAITILEKAGVDWKSLLAVKKMTPEEEVEALNEKIGELLKPKPETQTNGGCSNGHCQRIVEESELAELLGQGWHFVATLPSGKVVVSSD